MAFDMFSLFKTLLICIEAILPDWQHLVVLSSIHVNHLVLSSSSMFHLLFPVYKTAIIQVRS